MKVRFSPCVRCLACCLALGVCSIGAAAHETNPAGFGTCSPRSEKGSRDTGCYTIADQPVGVLGSGPVYWHVTRLGSKEEAERAREGTSTVIDAYDAVWLMTVGSRDWHAKGGTEVAVIGPLPVDAGKAYSALYMEATMRPGMTSQVHRHSGAEAWYTFSGETCLETPQGASTGGAGGPPVIIPAGLPMALTATGTTLRKSLVLILHAASEKPTTLEKAWRPKGLCKP